MCMSFPLHGWRLAQALRCAKCRVMFAFHSYFTYQIKDIWWNRLGAFKFSCAVFCFGSGHAAKCLEISSSSPIYAGHLESLPSGSLTSKDEHKVMGWMFICSIHMVGNFWPKWFCQKQLCLDLLRVQTPEESNAKGKTWFITLSAIIPPC